ncbi:MAG: GDSL-type esterase/lipase family protein [Elusimicrobia bacterium]|nr:GDSL-type esterase/lipase family protein [Elusimicrobiota bacterium]
MKKLIFVIFFAALLGCAQNTPVTGNGTTIVAFGDSFTQGYGVGRANNFPAILQDLTGIQVVNLGAFGNTMRQGANRKRRIGRYNPFLVIIQFGGNDGLRGRPLRETETALEEIVAYVQSLGATAVIIDTLGGLGDARTEPYTELMRRVANNNGAIFVPYIMEGIFTSPFDAMNPGAQAHRLLAQRLYNILSPYIRERE